MYSGGAVRAARRKKKERCTGGKKAVGHNNFSVRDCSEKPTARRARTCNGKPDPKGHAHEKIHPHIYYPNQPTYCSILHPFHPTHTLIPPINTPIAANDTLIAYPTHQHLRLFSPIKKNHFTFLPSQPPALYIGNTH